MHFDWDDEKDRLNQTKHDVSFYTAQQAFRDTSRIIHEDLAHSTEREKRFYCFGRVGKGIMTVRFTVRGKTIRIIGAGYWRKGRKIYETENHTLHR